MWYPGQYSRRIGISALLGLSVVVPVGLAASTARAAGGPASRGAVQAKLLGGGPLRLLGGALLGLGNTTVLGRDGNSNRPHDLVAHAYQFRPGAPGSFIRVMWDRPKSVRSSSVLGYVIWRGDPQTPLQVVGGFDGDSARSFIDNEAGRTVNAYNGVPSSDSAGARAQFVGVPGIVAGDRYVYQVATAYEAVLEDRNQDGQPDTGAAFMSPLSMTTRYVTALAPPSITAVNGASPGGAPQADLRHLTVEWQQTPGADTYVVVASSGPQFRSRATLATVRTVPLEAGGPATVSATVNANRRARGGHVFIAVGARHRGDPKPQPFGAIFGPPVEVAAVVSPPPPPGGASGPPAPPASGTRAAGGRHRHRR